MAVAGAQAQMQIALARWLISGFSCERNQELIEIWEAKVLIAWVRPGYLKAKVGAGGLSVDGGVYHVSAALRHSGGLQR